MEATTAENIIVEEDVEIAVKDISNTQTGKFELKEGWEAVSADERLLTQEELNRLVNNTEKEQVAVETDVMEGDSAIRVVEKDVDVDAFCEENGLNSKVDEGFILETVRKVIAENEKVVADYKGGKVKALQALFGSVMRELKGTGDPAVIRSLLEAEVNK